MKTLGIIGGIGPESTILYYRHLLKKCKEHDENGNAPHIIINSIDNKQLLSYAFNKQYDELASWLIGEINKLKQAGVDFALLAANLPHIVYNRIVPHIDLPLLSIIDETCKAIKEKGINKVALFGTRVTMQGGFYEETAKTYGIEIILPGSSEQEYIHDKYINELLQGIINSDTKKQLLQIIEEIKKKENIRGLILGGTELSLILHQEDMPGFEIFDTIMIHADSAAKYMTSTS